MSQEPPEEFQRQVNLDYYLASITLTRDLGLFAIKTLMTLNSGAFIVLLTFIGNTSVQSQFLIPLWNLKTSLFLFLCGLVLTTSAIATTYIQSQKATPYPDFSEEISDQRHLFWMMVFPTLAFLAFVIGVLLLVLNIGAS
jgi:hypothetical protein